jgi:hypothetical protein
MIGNGDCAETRHTTSRDECGCVRTASCIVGRRLADPVVVARRVDLKVTPIKVSTLVQDIAMLTPVSRTWPAGLLLAASRRGGGNKPQDMLSSRRLARALFRPLWDEEERAFHEDIAKTRVVKVHEP